MIKIPFLINILGTYVVALFLSMLYPNISTAQTIFVGYGPVHSHTEQTKKLVNGKDDVIYLYNQTILGVKYYVKKNLYINVGLANYSVITNMRLSKILREGFAGTKVTRTDIGVSYNLLGEKRRIFILPNFSMGLQYAKKTADLWAEQVHIYGPDYYQTRLPDSEGKSNFQLVPVAGFSMGVKFLKRCEAGIIIQGIYGYKTFQTLYFYYNHKDSPTIERTAIFESRGTGINSAIFLGINISKKGNSN